MIANHQLGNLQQVMALWTSIFTSIRSSTRWALISLLVSLDYQLDRLDAYKINETHFGVCLGGSWGDNFGICTGSLAPSSLLSSSLLLRCQEFNSFAPLHCLTINFLRWSQRTTD